MTKTEGRMWAERLMVQGSFAFSGGQWRLYYASGPTVRGNPSKAPSSPAGD